MLKLKPLRNIFILLSLLGQINFLTIFHADAFVLRVLYIICKMVYFISLVISLITPFFQIPSQMVLYTIYTVSFSYVIPILITIIESWIYLNILKSISTDLDNLIVYMENSLNNKVRVSNFVQQFYNKVMFVLFFCLIDLFAKCFVPSKVFTFPTAMVEYIGNLYNYITIFHILLYIDLLRFILYSLNERLSPTSNDKVKDCLVSPVSVEDAMHTMQHLKAVYLKIWAISEKINKCFGSFLLVSFVHFIFISINVVTGAIIVALSYSNDGKITLIRKWNYIIPGFWFICVVSN